MSKRIDHLLNQADAYDVYPTVKLRPLHARPCCQMDLTRHSGSWKVSAFVRNLLCVGYGGSYVVDNSKRILRYWRGDGRDRLHATIQESVREQHAASVPHGDLALGWAGFLNSARGGHSAMGAARPEPKPSVIQTAREVATAPKEDRRLVVINSGNDTLDNFYASNCKAQNWGRDRLGEDSLGAGKRKMFDLEDGSGECCFDLRVKFRGGEQRTNMGVNICRVAEWSVSNR